MCMACSRAPMTADRFSRAAFSEPGRLMIRLRPRVLQHGADGGAAGVLPQTLAAQVTDGDNGCCVCHIRYLLFCVYFLSQRLRLSRKYDIIAQCCDNVER